jgi:hypothetical protein
MEIRKLFRWIHRELGYFFVALTIVYGVSGIALNHRGDWNPDMSITRYSDSLTVAVNLVEAQKTDAEAILAAINEKENYKKHYYPSQNIMKIFFDVSGGSGSVIINTDTRIFEVERLERRFFFFPINRLHRNSFRKAWTWISDFYAVSLILFAITGMFMMRGKYGLAKHGIYLVIAGVLLPVIVYYFYS